MNNRLMMIIAVVAGLIATALAFLYIQSATSAVEQANKEPTVKVLFVQADLPANHRLDPDKDLVERTIGAHTAGGIVPAQERQSMAGHLTNAPLAAGGPLFYSSVVLTKDLDIGPGNRALSISVDASSSFAGLLVPNKNRVDILVSYKIPSPESNAPLQGVDSSNPQSAVQALLGRVIQQTSLPSEWDAEVVLENVRVLAVGDRLSASRGQFAFAPDQFATASSNIVTIEVSPDQALKLIRARAGGSNPMTLLMRPSAGAQGSAASSGLLREE